MINWIIEQPFNPDGSGENCVSREDGYIDLAVLSSDEANKEWLDSDRETIMNMRYLQLESIHINDIWKPSDELVFVRGVAGIGKSTLINRYVLKWARREILSGEDGKIEFLFFFECRDLNTMPDINNFEELIVKKYSGILKYIKISDLKGFADRVMIIVDGLDELQGIYERPNESFPTTELVETMINTKSPLLKGHKTVACGRPKACEFIKFKMLQSQKVKIIEVSGFNEANTIKYIERFFQNDALKCGKVKKIIQQPTIRSMSSVPVFLWIICLLYSEDFDHVINSSTELYTYGLFVFLKKHLRSLKHLKTLNELVSAQEFGKIVFSLTKLSVKTYMKHQVVFTDDDIKGIQCPIHLEQTGFIVKHSAGKFGCERYQFRHLAFQEYLSALYLCLSKGVSNFDANRELTSCTPTILGIHYLLKKQSSELFVAFYRNLMAVHRTSRSLSRNIMVPLRTFLFKRFIRQRLDPTKTIKDYTAISPQGFQEFSCDMRNFNFIEFIRNVRENGWLVDKDLIKEMKNYRTCVFVNNVWNQEFLEFLNALNVTRIHQLILTNENANEFGAAEAALIGMVDITSTKFEIHLTESTEYGMKYRSPNSLDISVKQRCTLPNLIKSLAFDFTIYQEPSILNRKLTFDELKSANYYNESSHNVSGNVYHILADLVEHVLQKKGKKKLRMEIDHDPEKHPDIESSRLFQNLSSEFTPRKYFAENIFFFSSAHKTYY